MPRHRSIKRNLPSNSCEGETYGSRILCAWDSELGLWQAPIVGDSDLFDGVAYEEDEVLG